MKTINTCISLTIGLLLSGCVSVSKTIPTVEIVRKKNKPVSAVMAKYNQAHTVRRAEAPLVCDNPNMKKRAGDKNNDNDTARVLILEENGSSNTILADVKVNCREYFENRTGWSNTQTVNRVTNTLPTPKRGAAIESSEIIENEAQQDIQNYVKKAVSQTRSNQKNYRIKSGDNLYQIARRHCTSFETLADINEIFDPTRISPGQVIRLPKGGC